MISPGAALMRISTNGRLPVKWKHPLGKSEPATVMGFFCGMLIKKLEKAPSHFANSQTHGASGAEKRHSRLSVVQTTYMARAPVVF